MSRRIETAGAGLTAKEQEIRRTDGGTLILTRLRGRLLTALLVDNRLAAASLADETPSRVGAVYVGRVKKAAKNIGACFVEIADGELCFLPLSECRSPYLLNRKFDGRILEGDELPVQVVSDPIKTKQATVTARLSLAGRLLVFSMGPSHVGMSGKLPAERRRQLLSLLEEQGLLSEGLVPQEEGMPSFGVILRTEAAGEESDEEVLKEFQSLRETFAGWFRQAEHLTCFSCISEAPPPFRAAVSGFYAGEYGRVVTDLADLYEPLAAYLHTDCHRQGLPVSLYEDADFSLIKLYGLETKLKEALSPRVWLKSGGYLVIEPTEALTVIDVNSGKCVGGKSSQETFMKLNREAAAEIARQMRLRCLSGIIVVDFINLESEAQRQELLETMRRLVQRDHIKTSVVDITPLGLMELTRKRLNKSLREQLQGVF